MAAALTACNAAVTDKSNSTTAATTETQAPVSAPANDPAPQTNIVVAVPERGRDWVDHKFQIEGSDFLISAPKELRVSIGDESIYVDLNGDNGMSIELEALDMAKEKQWYVESDSRQDLQWLIDTDSEALYTGLDLSAPKGHQVTNSFFAHKKIGTQSFSTNVDGILITNAKVYSLTAQEAQLLLGIFRTLRAQ